MKELILLQGDQLSIDFSEIGFDPDTPQLSICPQCSAQIIKLSDGCGVCGWSQEEKLQGDKCSFKQRITVERCDLKWAQELVTEHHYLHRPIHPRSLPFAYSISLDGLIIGTIIMATIHYTKKKELFGYDGLPTKWQVLQIARLWINPKYQGRQSNGHANNIASCAIAKMLKRVNADWLEHHPPVDPTQPYEIELILSYADTGVGHEGTIYKAANFERFDQTTNNRSRHGTYKGSNEPKILYVYRLNRKQKQQFLRTLLGDISTSTQGDELSIPCQIKFPHQEPIDGIIICDRGSEFDVQIDDRVIRVAKIYVFPKLAVPEKRSNLSPSKVPPSKTRRKKGEGTGYIYRRTITRKGKQYQEFYYRYRDESGKLRSKYISQRLLNRIQEAVSLTLPITEVLRLLGVNEISRGEQFSTSDDENLHSNDKSDELISLIRGEQVNNPSTKRRKYGYGGGYIECKPITKNGNQYKQYWFHWQVWRDGETVIKKTRYIPKKQVSKVMRMNNEKVPVEVILKVLESKSKGRKK